MPNRSLAVPLSSASAAFFAALLVLACGSSGDPGPQAGQAGAATNGSAGAPTAGATGVGGAANPGAGPASFGGASNVGGGGASSAGAPSTAGAGGTIGVAGAVGVAGAPAGTAGAAGAPAVSKDLWVAPDGLDSNPGTEAKPLLNLSTAAVRMAIGGTVWIKAGTYKYTNVVQLKRSGAAATPMTISAVAGTRPVINFTTPAAVRGFEISGDYWHLVGFEVANASDNCIAISGSHNTIENLSIHGCGDTGLQITVGTAQVADATRGAYNLILNVDSYENLDVATGGENADGFAAKLRIGAGNVFRGCRAYNNADDGWDFFAADDVVEIDGSWAFLNGKGVNGENPSGDGNGFKLGGKPTSVGEGGAVHIVKGSFAFENLACGYTQNSNPDVPKLTGCGAKDNKTDYCQTLSKSGEVSMTMTAAQAKAVKRNADGSLPPMK